MLKKLLAQWALFKYSLTINRCPVQTEHEAIQEARKRLMELLYPDKKKN
jgi:hypothetical protein